MFVFHFQLNLLMQHLTMLLTGQQVTKPFPSILICNIIYLL